MSDPAQLAAEPAQPPAPVYDLGAVARQVNASIFRICQKSAFFASLALHARVEVRLDLPTAATDGSSIFVNPGFFMPLSNDQRDGLMLHEVLHAALLHVQRRGARDPRLWNIAADIVVNGIILDTGVYALPEGGVVDDALKKYSVEEVYELLLQRADKQTIQITLVDLIEGEPSEQDGKGGGDKQDGDGDPAKGKTKTGENPDWAEVLEKAKIIARDSGQGDTPERMRREIDAIGRSRIDWRSYLWRFMVQTPTDFGAWDRRFIGDGLYLETLHSETVRVALCVDTSGSIDTKAFHALIIEVTAILHTYPGLMCDLYYADAEVHGPWALKADEPIPPAVGGGGTDFRPFFEAMAQRGHEAPALAIYMTDGYGDFPKHDPGIPTLWAVLPGERPLEDFPFGETMRILPSA
jgi:predicted metal-dependent peptidase